MLVRALELAVARIAERQGDDPADWRWGREHVALGEHRPLGSSPLARLFNLRGPAPGGIYTVNAFEFSPLDEEEPFVARDGPSLRAVYDLSDLGRSRFHPLDRPVGERAFAALRQLRGTLATRKARDHTRSARSVRGRRPRPPSPCPAMTVSWPRRPERRLVRAPYGPSRWEYIGSPGTSISAVSTWPVPDSVM